MSRKAAQRLISDAASAGQASPEERWERAFNSPAPIRPAAFLEAAVAWHEQVLLHGDIAPDVAEKLEQAADAVRASRMNCTAAPTDGAVDQVHAPRTNSAATAPRVTASRTKSGSPAAASHPASSELAPGTRLVKIHGGHTHVVEVTSAGMLYQGQLYSSLSAVAKAITGTHWNGLLFFGLRKRKTYPKAGADG
ncbi:DUF2924 domain-containing protein [Sphingomonas sp. Tas61C01]|uniref:DUF2924 domain-containing protein n=1 Tax=Sphingomonas sp. Tas61C01 TaxID=3458297 RepID=UPI00403EC682